MRLNVTQLKEALRKLPEPEHKGQMMRVPYFPPHQAQIDYRDGAEANKGATFPVLNLISTEYKSGGAIWLDWEVEL